MTGTGTETETGTAPPMAFRRILVVAANDPGDVALFARAAHLARSWDAEVALLHVIEPPSEIDRIARAVGLDVPAIEDRLTGEARAALTDRLAETALRPSGAPAVRVGKTFLEVIRAVQDGGADIVLKTAETLDGGRSGLFASTDQHLLRKCPCPVWLAPRDGAPQVRTVLAAVDVDMGQASDRETLAGLNRRLVETIARVAAGDREAGGRLDIHLLHAWDAPGEGLVRLWSDSGDPDRAAMEYAVSIETTHWRALAGLAEELTGLVTGPGGRDGPKGRETAVKVHPTLRRGRPREVIPAAVAALDADLLVMGTVARTGVPGLIIGNTAEDILNSVSCAVLTVKPPGYVSPLLGAAIAKDRRPEDHK